MRGTVYLISSIFLAAVASQACRLGELTFKPVQVPSLLNSTQNFEACRYEMTPFIARYATVYYSIYYWSRVILIHIVPCSTLVVLNVILIRTMRAAHQHRRQMSRRTVVTTTETPASQQYELQRMSNNTQDADTCTLPSRRHGGRHSSTRSTMMLIVVVCAFLFVEIPLCVLLLIVIVENTFHVDVFSDMARYTAALVVNCFTAITDPLNFFIYCAMSERFRRTLCGLFTRRHE